MRQTESKTSCKHLKVLLGFLNTLYNQYHALNLPSLHLTVSPALTLRVLSGLGELLQLPAQVLGLLHAPPLSQTQSQVLPL